MIDLLLDNKDFNQDGQPDNISFMIKRLKIHGLDALDDMTYRFTGKYGVEEYLEIFSGKFNKLNFKKIFNLMVVKK